MAAPCDREQIASAINAAGETLRQMTQAAQPTLQTKLLKLKEVKGWSDADYEEKGYALLEDERTGTLDAAANELVERLDKSVAHLLEARGILALQKGTARPATGGHTVRPAHAQDRSHHQTVQT